MSARRALPRCTLRSPSGRIMSVTYAAADDHKYDTYDRKDPNSDRWDDSPHEMRTGARRMAAERDARERALAAEYARRIARRIAVMPAPPHSTKCNHRWGVSGVDCTVCGYHYEHPATCTIRHEWAGGDRCVRCGEPRWPPAPSPAPRVSAPRDDETPHVAFCDILYDRGMGVSRRMRASRNAKRRFQAVWEAE